MSYPVSCIVCGRRDESLGVTRYDAWAKVADERGWRIARSPSGEWYELRCPEHRQVKPEEPANEGSQ